jgi:acyl-CoA dehydrogenase
MSTDTETTALIDETVDRLLSSVVDHDTIEAAEAERWSARTWDPLAEAGFPWVGVPETSGGSGGSILDALAVLRQVGRHAAPVPVAETGLLGGWLLSSAGLDVASGPITVAAGPIAIHAGRLRGVATVAWATRAERIAVIVPGEGNGTAMVASLQPDQVEIVPGANLAGEPRDQVTIDVALSDVEHAPGSAGDTDALRNRGALSRVVMAAGAMEAMSQMTIDYTNARHQFGQAVARFQAVQQHLVTVAQCSVRLSMAADLASRAMAQGTVGSEIAVAKVIADETSVLATRAAHQAHGAMGVTREYSLHQLSRRLWAWRHEYGSGSQWRRQLGREVFAAGPDQLFALITG